MKEYYYGYHLTGAHFGFLVAGLAKEYMGIYFSNSLQNSSTK